MSINLGFTVIIKAVHKNNNKSKFSNIFTLIFEFNILL